MRILALIDDETGDARDPQFRRRTRFGAEEVERHVVAALRRLGHAVTVMALDIEPARALQSLKAIEADLVFNLTEHLGGDRAKDALVAQALERRGHAYTGAGPKSLVLCRDKARSKSALRRAGFDVPGFAVLKPGQRQPPASLRYPVLVKPLAADASEGIARSSLARDARAARARIAFLHRSTGRAAICEEFIAGREIKIPLLGNVPPVMLAPREVVFGRQGPQFITSRVKGDAAYRRRWDITYPKAALSRAERDRVARLAAAMYRLLGMRDYGKIDIRLTDEGRVVFIEANPNPDLSPAGFGLMASWSGIDYTKLIGRIVALATARAKERRTG